MKKHKLYSLLITIIFLVAIKNKSSAQDLLGKWMPVMDETEFYIPRFPIFVIKKKELKIYNFDTLYKLDKKFNYKAFEKEMYQIDDNTFLAPVISKKTFKKFTKNVRITPTKIYYPVDSILSKQYQSFYKSPFFDIKPTLIKFNQELVDYQIYDIIGEMALERFELKKIEETYFITYFLGKRLQKVVPIKEIHKDYLLVYGVLARGTYVKLYKIEEIKRSYLPFEE